MQFAICNRKDNDLNRGAELGNRLPVLVYTGVDIARDANELELSISVVNTINPRSSRNARIQLLGLLGDGYRFRF
jgi:hypothetical protein